MTKTYSADRILNGFQEYTKHSIVVEHGIINHITPIEGSVSSDFHSDFIVPAFIDIQIYGAKGKLFSMYPTVETLYKMNEYCRDHGCFQFLPTLATNTAQVFHHCIDAVRQYWNEGGKGVIGLHLEGPWINPIKKGAHIESLIHSPTLSEVKEILQYGKGVIKMITLAPEKTPQEIIELIRSENIIVSAGHSNATFQEAEHFFRNGITAVTHLFNAMSNFHHRDTGLPGAVFQHDKVMASIIADGIHVDYNAIAVAKKLMGDRLFLITDAVTETSEGPYQHKLDTNKFVADGVLSGSSLTLIQAIRNCNVHAGISLEEGCRMASLYPAQLLDINSGSIEIGSEAVFLLLNKNFQLERIVCS